MDNHSQWKRLSKVGLALLAPVAIALVSMAVSDLYAQSDDSGDNDCASCHSKHNSALVMQWKDSRHAEEDVSCIDCHGADEGDVDGWTHHGEFISVLVTPKDCGGCHDKELSEFAGSHHAKAGEILASLDNVLAEKVAGLPHNNADAINGCWQCHGTIIKFERDSKGEILRSDEEGMPIIDASTWPNSGIGRLNPDGSKGSCNACHSRHNFDAKLARSPENCGKCHMGPDHPQIEIYNESKHGIAFYANRDKMALDSDTWVLGEDYSAAPTCATCHISAYKTPSGVQVAASHDVGERISWTLRPVVSVKLNKVIYEDGFREDYPDTRKLPNIGAMVMTTEKIVDDYELKSHKVERKVAKIVRWNERRAKMKGACVNCHSTTFVDNFYEQFDGLVDLYNEKFGIPAKQMMTDLKKDGVLNPDAPFEHEVQWIFWELWHHEGRRARHGASMMGPDYTHWHGMYEVSKHYYQKFLPAVIEAAATKSPEMEKKYADRIAKMMLQEEHSWKKGLKPEEAERLRKMYEDRYDE